jgi:hypothetical protein
MSFLLGTGDQEITKRRRLRLRQSPAQTAFFVFRAGSISGELADGIS